MFQPISPRFNSWRGSFKKKPHEFPNSLPVGQPEDLEKTPLEEEADGPSLVAYQAKSVFVDDEISQMAVVFAIRQASSIQNWQFQIGQTSSNTMKANELCRLKNDLNPYCPPCHNNPELFFNLICVF